MGSRVSRFVGLRSLMWELGEFVVVCVKLLERWVVVGYVSWV